MALYNQVGNVVIRGKVFPLFRKVTPRNKYKKPHQGARECARRRRQMGIV